MEPSRDKPNNTPALQNVIGCGSPVAQFGAMGAAMRNGQEQQYWKCRTARLSLPILRL